MQDCAANKMASESCKLVQTDREAVLKHYGLIDKKVEEDIQIIKLWLSEQPHLPNVEEDNEIEKFLLACKFNIEKTKNKLDAYFTMRCKAPELFANRDPLSESIINVQKIACCIVSPIQTDKHESIFFIKLTEPKPELFKPLDFLKLIFMLLEFTRNQDYFTGHHFVIDFDGVKLGHLLKLTPTMVQKTVTSMTKTFPVIITSVHFINSPVVADAVITLVKSLLNSKIASRIHVHRTQEKLFDFFPAKCLPKDYGGTEKSISELKETSNKEMLAYRPWFLREENRIADESKRPKKSEKENSFGFMYSSFGKLDID